VITVREARRSDVQMMAPTLRPRDISEIGDGWLWGPEQMEEALTVHLDASERAWSFVEGADVLCMFGITREGQPPILWVIGGALIDENRIAFARASRRAFDRYLANRTLFCGVGAEDSAGLKWARWLGGDVGEAAPYGPHGRLFHPITFGASPCRGWH
jgi:hypothetical protein